MISRLYLSLALLLLTYSASAQSTPSVVVSIKPIHSIVSSLMQGVGVPQLLLETNESAHGFHIRPSQVMAIENADLIVSIDPKFEAGLANILSTYSASSQLIISELNLANFYTFRGNGEAGEHDYHLWLDVNNVRAVAKHLANRLIKIDADNTSTYSRNLEALNVKLLQLHKDNNAQLAELAEINFANYSDTIQYFEKSYNLNQPIIITPYHGARLSIRGVLNAKKKMKQQQVKCLLHTNEISLEKTDVIVEGVAIMRNEISILGNELESGPDQYFNLMKNLTSQISQCLR
ncbi:MAG TPA: ABC transporter substrate-binding protein [Candidatus Thioglobus sp.]|jgi:zinc transport system substrate-binding protein|nr:ABC transporter substrate-binding protein [Candidatus Thioglobus sp.]HIL21158.1 ABC transporter substrate-binding protein [Candidatus Thioglobus sp.]